MRYLKCNFKKLRLRRKVAALRTMSEALPEQKEINAARSTSCT